MLSFGLPLSEDVCLGREEVSHTTGPTEAKDEDQPHLDSAGAALWGTPCSTYS